MAAAGGGLRREALSLYRQLLRAAAGKPGFAARIRQEFRRGAALPPRDRLRAEFLLRRGRRQLQQLRAPSTARMGVFGAPPGDCAATGAGPGAGPGAAPGAGVGPGAGPGSAPDAGPAPGPSPGTSVGPGPAPGSAPGTRVGPGPAPGWAPGPSRRQ
ncbi:succinate dehydrogenase assembly factor 1, mitochondrial [Aythya fuligula]|uniref:Succinate dehydrogenase assembly factor 1, mitochondrial n=1 Tax=Aythya fuligula TaxID=219594 RepID=A0A6J3ENQ9_AYTFU|nr:succinate dehydrogenase assembly factor 1, mitochondrial [Aythya fuligula]